MFNSKFINSNCFIQNSLQRMQKQDTELICGECLKPYSSDCQSPTKCIIHRGECFACNRCRPQVLLIDFTKAQCQNCGRYQLKDDMFYDYRCDVYLCRNHFDTSHNNNLEFKLPCKNGCREELGQVLEFMSNFCSQCRRKNTKDHKWEVCYLCKVKNHKKSIIPKEQFTFLKKEPTLLKQEPTLLKKEEPAFLKKEPTLIKQEPSQPILLEKNKSQKSIQCDIIQEHKVIQPEKSEFSKLHMERLIRQQQQIKKLKNQISDQLKINQIINQNYQEAEMRLRTSQSVRLNIKKNLLNSERDEQCPICLKFYQCVGRRPMLLCVKQHLICEECLNGQYKQKQDCPLCHVKIQRSQILPARERLRTLDLEGIIMMKLKDVYQIIQKNEGNESKKQFKQFRISLKDSYVQTQQKKQIFAESSKKVKKIEAVPEHPIFIVTNNKARAKKMSKK